MEPIFSAKKRAWVCSPWISKFYAEKLFNLSKQGVEVRIVTSDDEYNADTYSYLSQLPQTTNFDVHFVKKETVHSKMYVIDDNYAIAGSVNFTYRGLHQQTNNFAIYENQEIEPIINDFKNLWIGFKSENIRPTQSTLENVLPILPYDKALVPEIVNSNILRVTWAKLFVRPYYKIQYSLLENVHLPWYQQTVVEDKGMVVIDASNAEVLNYGESSNFDSSMRIKELSKIVPLKESAVDFSDKFEFENQQWNVKINNYRSEELAKDYVKHKNRKELPYTDRREGLKYQSYAPSNRAITIRSNDLILVPTWHFRYAFMDKEFERVILASSGQILKSSFLKGGAVCEDCGKSISKDKKYRCPICTKWLCISEMVECSSCEGLFHKKHISKTCPICMEILCDDCVTVCPICKAEYGKNHAETCNDCGLTICSGCVIISGRIFKKKRCPDCDFQSKNR
jgi:HKD family nuclease